MMKKTKIVRITDVERDRESLNEAGRIIRAGGLVVFPTETVYGIGANGLDSDACRSIYTAKGRPSDNPLILTVPDKKGVMQVARELPPLAEALLDRFWPGPLTVIFPRRPNVPDAATGGLDTVALRCPDHAVARAFLRSAGVPVAGPSANLSGRPSPTTAAEAAHDMEGRVDMIIDGGPCHIGVESTIVECIDERTVTILRPGGVTAAMLGEVAERVLVDTALSGTAGVPKAPGMKYRHYAPAAAMIVYVGSGEAVAAAIAAQRRETAGKRIGYLVSSETAAVLPQENCYIWGNRGDKAALANQLYGGLLFFDSHPVDLILAEGVDEDGLGAAIMNRMGKAAGGHVVVL